MRESHENGDLARSLENASSGANGYAGDDNNIGHFGGCLLKVDSTCESL